MERGTDSERAAVRREWDAMERERRLTTRLLAGIALALVGVLAVLTLAGLPLEACLYTRGLRPGTCSVTVVSAAGQALLVAVGVVALTAGGWLSLGSARRLRRGGRHPR